MKGFLKQIISSVCFISILVLLLSGTSRILQPKSNTKSAGAQDPLANGISDEPDGTIDALFIGDSETYCAFVPLKIWRESGITSYVCGTSGQKLCYSMELLRKAFKNQNPKMVVLETNAIFREFKTEDAITTKAQENFSVFKYHNRWKNLKPAVIKAAVNYTVIDNTKGYLYNTTVDASSAKDYMKISEDFAEIPLKNARYVKDIRNYCERKGAKLVLISSPSTKNWNYKRHNSISKLAAELEVEYIDMNLLREEIPIDWKNDTRDKGDHLNYYGAVKVSSYLGKYFLSTDMFTDKRQNKKYSDWNKAAESFEKRAAGK